jgi:hypothetical protein
MLTVTEGAVNSRSTSTIIEPAQGYSVNPSRLQKVPPHALNPFRRPSHFRDFFEERSGNDVRWKSTDTQNLQG